MKKRMSDDLNWEKLEEWEKVCEQMNARQRKIYFYGPDETKWPEEMRDEPFTNKVSK